MGAAVTAVVTATIPRPVQCLTYCNPGQGAKLGSIPLVALQVKQPEQPDFLSQYGKLMQLKQQQQMAPLQQQEAQQQVQQGQIATQQAQQGQQDQMAFRQAMQDPSMQGKTIGQISDALAQKGAISQASWVAAKKADLEHQESLTKLTGEQLDNLNKGHAQTQTLYNNIQQMPDDQLSQNWPQIAQQFNSIPGNEKSPLNPQQPLTKQQLAQYAPLISMNEAYLNDAIARKKASVDEQTAEAGLGEKQAAAKFYQQNGGAPGVPVEAIQQADWMKQNPGKGPSDFVAWKARQNPMALVMGNMLGGQGNSEALDFAAQNYRMTGQMPAGYTRSPGTTSAIISRAAELDSQEGGQGIAMNKTVLNANKTSLTNLQKNFDQVSAFESTASKNLDLYLDKLNQIPDLGAKFANVPMRMINDKMIGTANYQAMKAAQQTAAAETAKVLSSANASGVLSDTQKKEAEDMLSGNLSYAAAQKVVQTLKQDFANRHQSYQQQIGDIQGRLKTAGGATAQPNAAPNSNDPFAQFGGKAHHQ